MSSKWYNFAAGIFLAGLLGIIAIASTARAQVTPQSIWRLSGSNVSTIISSWKAGVGTTTPHAKLTVQGTASNTDNIFEVASSTGAVLLATNWGGVTTIKDLIVSGTCTGCGAVSGANPTGTIGLTAINGSATTYLRSDGAPALSQAIIPTWTGLHTFTTGGLIINASSSATAVFNFSNATTSLLTNSGSVWFTPLATPAGTLLAVDPNGKLIATSTPSGVISSVSNSDSTLTISPTTGAVVASLNLGNPNSWTALQTFATASSTNATSTNLTVTGNTIFHGLGSALLGTDNTGKLVATSSVGVSYLTGTLPVSKGGTGASTLTGCLTGNGTGAITGSGTCNTSAASVTSITGGLGLKGGTITTSGTFSLESYLATSTADTTGQILTFTSTNATPATFGGDSDLTFTNGNLLTATNASTTNATVATFFQLPNSTSQSPTLAGALAYDTTSGQLKVGDGVNTDVIGSGNFYPAFTISTTTAWTGTTTRPIGTAYIGETWNGWQCWTDVGTLDAVITDGTNRMNYIKASTTVGTNTLSTNNTFTAAEKRYVEIGNPASSPTYISCSVSKSFTAD